VRSVGGGFAYSRERTSSSWSTAGAGRVRWRLPHRPRLACADRTDSRRSRSGEENWLIKFTLAPAPDAQHRSFRTLRPLARSPRAPRYGVGLVRTPSRIIVSLFSGTAAAAIVALLVLGAVGGRAAEAPCGTDTNATYVATSLGVAQRIAAEERAGPTVSRAKHTIESDTTLAKAIARDDVAAVHQQIGVLLYNHEHIVRIRLLSASGHVIADVGGALVLSPITGVFRIGGRVVGSFVFSVQDDMGYRLLAQRLVGAESVMRYQGRTVMSNIGVGSQPLLDGGTVTVGGAAYLVTSVVLGHFPTGQLHVSLLIRTPPASLATQSCLQIRADVLGAVARRVYMENQTGPAIQIARAAIRGSAVLPAALAHGDIAAARASAQRLLRAAHILRIRVLSNGRSVLDVRSTSRPLVQPVAVSIEDRSHRLVGVALVAVQSVDGFVGIASYLTNAPIVSLAGSTELTNGDLSGLPPLPSSGPVTAGGASYHVASFDGTLYPSGVLAVHLLSPDAPQP
jgi:hypothetical protein